MRIRDADTLIGPAVTNAVQALTLEPEDDAAVALARQYAAAIDDADNPADALEKLGPKLLSVLEQLGATPRARAQITKGAVTNGSGQSKLAALRAAR